VLRMPIKCACALCSQKCVLCLVPYFRGKFGSWYPDCLASRIKSHCAKAEWGNPG